MLGFKASDLGHQPRKLGLGTAARAATVITGVVSAVVVTRTAIPYSAAVIAAAIPVVRSWMAPPFIFVAIHFIILTIWKLSENHHQHDTPHLDDNKTLARIASPEIPQTAVVEDFAESEVIISNSFLGFGRSMSERNTCADIKLNSREIEKSDFTIMSVEERPMVLVTAEEDDLMEASWKSVMQVVAAPVARFDLPEAADSGGSVREVSEAGEEDLNKRIDAFIRKNYEQIRTATALGDG